MGGQRGDAASERQPEEDKHAMAGLTVNDVRDHHQLLVLLLKKVLVR
jgi:hypothetical protein